MNGLGMHAAQDGHALLRDRIEAPLLARIKELEDALSEISDLEDADGINLARKIARAALTKKEKL